MYFRIIFSFIAIIFMAQCLLLANEPSLEGQPADSFFVEKVNRYSDLDNNEYYFKIVLDNKQTFEVVASLEDLLTNKIYEGMPFQFIEEEFVPREPWLSTFTYLSMDGTIQLQNKFDSIHSHWHPDESVEIIELEKKWAWRSGMSNVNYSIRFSDGAIWGLSYQQYNSGVFNVGDRFFRVQPHAVLVNVADGKVITRDNYSRFVPVNW